MVPEVDLVDGLSAGAKEIGYRSEDTFEIVYVFQCGAADYEVELLASKILAQLFRRRYNRLCDLTRIREDFLQLNVFSQSASE